MKGVPNMQTFEADIDKNGTVRLREALTLPAPRRALVTVLDEDPPSYPNETALLSQPALADWNRPEEDEAWSHLQPGR
jgi:hypothetical protein